MKKGLSIILLFVVSTIFVGSLLSVVLMNHNKPMKKCPLARLTGNTQCLFNTSKDTTAIIGHIASISISILAIDSEDLHNLLMLFISSIVVFIIWNTNRKISELFFKQNNFREINIHNNRAWFPLIPKFLLNWLKMKTRGQIDMFQVGAYNNS